MVSVNCAMIGFGSVGKSLLRLLESKKAELSRHYDLTISITGVSTQRHGTALNPAGLNASALLQAEDISHLSVLPAPESMLEFMRQSQAEIIFEATPVNYTSGQPAVDYLRAALSSGKHAITANKGPVVHAYQELKSLAAQNGVSFLFESTVMDGAPVFSLFRETVPAARLLSFSGVLNSTTNLILTRMESGESFQQAVTFCQQVGIAETNPQGDIEGWDAAVKVSALVNVLMGVPLLPGSVQRQGIEKITLEDVQAAKSQGKRWKLVCSAQIEAGGVTAHVQPELVGSESPFYQVSGTSSLIQFETDVLGLLTIIENDPGPGTTAYGMLADMLRALDLIQPRSDVRS